MTSDPIAHGTYGKRELRLQPRHQEQHVHADQQNGRQGAKHAGVEAERKADGCREEADGHERRRQAGGRAIGPRRFSLCAVPSTMGEQRQHARREHREHAGKKR